MKKLNATLCIVFLVFVYGFAGAHLLMPDRSFSEMENRMLAKVPRATFKKVFSGQYATEFTAYLNDQFPLRDGFKSMSTAYQYITLKREIGGVYLKGQRLFSHLQEADATLLNQNIQSIRKLQETLAIPVYVALIPDAACILKDELPSGAPGLNQEELIQKVYGEIGENCLDIASSLLFHKDEDIFYRTDHHWTSLGAYYGYEELIRALGMQPVALSSYKKTELSDDFYGTLYAKAPAFWIYPDTIESYAGDLGTTLSVFDGTGFKEGSLYVPENLAKKDQYAVFLGGNQPLIVLETVFENEPNLLVLRDSYFDSLTPFLQTHFSSVHLIDVRYYQKTIEDYIRDHDIDIVLCAYSVDQFSHVVRLSTVVGSLF
ncbi:MAG: DHHW family protein [Peptococcaceae bacterium]